MQQPMARQIAPTCATFAEVRTLIVYKLCSKPSGSEIAGLSPWLTSCCGIGCHPLAKKENNTMRRVIDVVAIVCGTCTCSLLVSCGAAPTDLESEESALTAAAVSDPTNTLLYAGDIAQCTETSKTNGAKTAALAKSRPGTKIAMTEGNNCTGTYTEYTDWFDPVWGQQAFDTGGTSLYMRARPVPGNHDTNQGRDPAAQGFRQYWQFPSNDIPTWYIVDVNPSWLIIALDSTKPNDATQLAWLDSVLANNTAPCILAYYHHPRYSSGLHGSQDGSWDSRTRTYRTDVRPLYQPLINKKADIIIGGHDHNYERLVMDNTVQFVVGTGGAALSSGWATTVSGSKYKFRDKYGILQLTLNASGTYTAKFVAAGGATYDTTSGTCKSKK
jgi:acid phosphatase type 7